MYERKKYICRILCSCVNIIILSRVIQYLNFINTLKVMNLNIKYKINLNILRKKHLKSVFKLFFYLKINLKLLYKN